ncbi:MAG TPA: glucose 1-dehydrogenase [Candidatus Binatia bacterium]|jgi:NAD(P)-dependent dehydrogenase (short-subunit alcohol dehydrogenase family)|nr:glucose 1-dehydrogenase [Candidatus Binatia bacterium]
MKLKDQVAIVTGAGRNIGKAIAKLFADEGAKVVVADMDRGRGQSVVSELQKSGHQAMLVLCDISNSKDVQDMVKKVVEHFGGIDILVNNAAMTDRVNILESTEEEFDKVISVSLKGTYLVSKYVAAQMVQQGKGGKILNLASTSGLIGRKDAIAYSAAKGGVVNMTRSMAVQLAPYKIRVNSLTPNRSGSPVGMDDDAALGRAVKNLAGRLGTAEDQARAALFLVSDDSDFVHGANLIVDGGVMATADLPTEGERKK